ncbi:MAG: UDP-N-acetylmuramoyl-L-alanine--D-glutamate ligase [Prevotella sp.]|nr:UDP-N-acetylmuramoyl-L-alanine--D-glutamate ligase [Prevotella sp.]MCM1075048.1 UDP-N-acetylmuramoyl-L-alanine--D-glutamate ligase [Ruminococcus sp.]
MKRIVILGGGESGVGAAVLAKTKGYDTFLSDMGKIAPKYLEVLDKYGIDYEHSGPHTADLILNADEVIKSPGVPPTATMVRAVTEKGIPVISEIEFAGRFTDAKMICITGSNGKTTTTLLLYHILQNAGFNVGLAGNVGKSLALQVAETRHDYYVIELSSFQLENMYEFKADIAILLNITPDHMDRYDHKMENYVNAKFRIMQNMQASEAFIYWKDDPVVAAKLATLSPTCEMLPFSEFKAEGLAAWTQDGNMIINTKQEAWEMPRAELSLKGLHNLYNSMAASIAASKLDIAPEVIRKALGSFKSVEHRLEFAGKVDGVTWINDSKATNVNSTWYALESMTTPTVLILGGTDKGNDYTEIEAFVREKVKAIVCMGVDNKKLLDFWGNRGIKTVDTHTLEDAVKACRELACAGDTVLLSPCCASFDLFKNYEQRGELFKQAVANLK